MKSPDIKNLSKGRLLALVLLALCLISTIIFLSRYNIKELYDFKFLDAIFPDATENGFKVVEVVDGDTVIIDLNGTETTIRLIGVDTPETVHPDEEKNCVFGETASEYLKSRLEGEYIDIEYDNKTKDSYGRTLAYVYIGNEMLNETIIKNGYGVYYYFPDDTHRYDDRFIKAQKYAQENFLGMWDNSVSDEDTGGVKENSRL